MVYIVTEDEKSGYLLWSAIADVINSKSNKKLVSVEHADGNHNLYNTVIDIQINTGDKILVAIDNIGDVVAKEVQNIRIYCKRCGIYCDFTDYYSIEEVFISYSDWAKRSAKLPTHSNGKNAVKESECYKAYWAIYTQIKNGIEYNPCSMAECQDFVARIPRKIVQINGKNRKAYITKEKVLTHLIAEYTNHSIYKIGHKTISDCWLNDCCLHKNQDLKDNCQYNNRNSHINKQESLDSKLGDLAKNSILQNEILKIKQLCKK